MPPTRAKRSLTETVEAFEAHVLGQIDPGPWTPVTDYSIEGRREAEGIHPALIREVFQPLKVLDFGCGPGCLVGLLRELGVQAEGYEPFYRLNIERADPLVRPFIHPTFPTTASHDLVVCREVLEHVPLKGGQFLDTIRRIVKASTRYIYVTTRYAQRPSTLLGVDLADNLDPTHITLLHKEFVRTLFVLAGCQSRKDLEDRMDWMGKGRCLVFERC
jgi:2-polyprenyl-3-methyl-5-hydroxy-6-metoxy-1,4-benzoquinol methylase